MGIERFPVGAQIEVRAAKADGKRQLVGYAVVYGTRSQDLGGFVEVIAPGAFTASIQSDDIRALWNHDDNIVLGRTKSGTLQLVDEARGVRVAIDAPAGAGQQIESIERGDVDGMSFGFYVDRDAWAMVDNLPVRTVLQARLVEVSPVAFPAYLSSSVGMRSLYGEVPTIPESIQRALVEHSSTSEATKTKAGADGDASLEKRGSKQAMKGNAVQMRRDAAQHLQRANTLDATANAAGRDLSEEELAEYKVSMAENRRLLAAAVRAEELEAANPEEVEAGDEEDEKQPIEKRSFNPGSKTAKRYSKRGDNERNALIAYIRRGDPGGLLEQRAVVDSTMNITTAADGGYAVPVDHHNEIVLKRNDMRVADKLGVRKVNGAKVIRESGTVTAATATNEETAYTRDAMQIGEVDFALAKYTVKIDITEELEEDNDVNLLESIEDYVARAFALQHNTALVAALASGGSTSVSLTGIVAAAAHIPAMAAALPDGYADNPKFLMRRATAFAYYALTGNPFQFVDTPPGAGLFGYDVVHSGAVAAIAASAVPLYFADWYQVGLREKAGLVLVRDIYSEDGRTLLKYRQRFKYATLQAEGVLRGTYAAS